MNTQKVVAFVAAMAITAANLYGIAAYTNSLTRAAQQKAATINRPIQTLPTIEVTPSADQLRQLRNEGNAPDGSAAATSGAAMMPYYSFAADTTSA